MKFIYNMQQTSNGTNIFEKNMLTITKHHPIPHDLSLNIKTYEN